MGCTVTVAPRSISQNGCCIFGDGRVPTAAPVAPLDQAEEANSNLKHPNIVNSCVVCVRVCVRASEVAVQANMGKRRGGGALKGSNYLNAGSQAGSQD